VSVGHELPSRPTRSYDEVHLLPALHAQSAWRGRVGGGGGGQVLALFGTSPLNTPTPTPPHRFARRMVKITCPVARPILIACADRCAQRSGTDVRPRAIANSPASTRRAAHLLLPLHARNVPLILHNTISNHSSAPAADRGQRGGCPDKARLTLFVHETHAAQYAGRLGQFAPQAFLPSAWPWLRVGHVLRPHQRFAARRISERSSSPRAAVSANLKCTIGCRVSASEVFAVFAGFSMVSARMNSCAFRHAAAPPSALLELDHLVGKPLPLTDPVAAGNNKSRTLSKKIWRVSTSAFHLVEFSRDLDTPCSSWPSIRLVAITGPSPVLASRRSSA